MTDQVIGVVVGAADVGTVNGGWVSVYGNRNVVVSGEGHACHPTGIISIPINPQEIHQGSNRFPCCSSTELGYWDICKSGQFHEQLLSFGAAALVCGVSSKEHVIQLDANYVINMFQAAESFPYISPGER